MKFKPHRYQTYVKDFIVDHPAAGVFLDMGLGKTVIALSAIEELQYERFEVSNVLVIAPPTVAVDTWPSEVKKWDHLKHLDMVLVMGSPKQRLERLLEPHDIYVVSNAVVPWLVQNFVKNWKFDMVVIDELSAFKSTNTKRFRSLRNVRGKIKRVVGLTGTPAPNHLIELWPQMFLLDQGESLGKGITGFKNKYFYPKRANGHIVYEWGLKEGSEEAIYERIAGNCISMKAKDYLDMPERIDISVPVRLSEREKVLYRELEKTYILEIAGEEIVASNAAVLSNKLLQLNQGAIYTEGGGVQVIHDKKLKALERIMEEANGRPVLCVYQYKHDLKRILATFGEKYRVSTYESPKDREKWDKGEIDLLCIHPASCKYGLNLQSHNIMVWFGLTWSLESYQQTVARLWRQGQKNTVVVYHLVVEDTVDEKVMRALESKKQTQDAVMEAVKAEVDKFR